MVAFGASPQDFIRLPIVLGFGLALFFLDLALPAALGLTQLYPVALIALYGVRTLRVIVLCWATYCLLILAGHAAAGVGDDTASRAVLMLAVSLAALALTRIAAREQRLREQALIDPLTGTFNRRWFIELSDKETARTRRHGNVSAVLMLDIDHFKQINDRYGHAAGDVVLRAIADICAKLLRPSDILARYGGEEFVICLAETDEDRACHVAERLCKSIERTELRAGRHVIKCTVSIGVAGCSAEAPLNDAIARADAALYRAKEAGRNRVELAAEMPPASSIPSTIERISTGTGGPPAAEARRVNDVILIVDDEEDVRGLLAEWLGGHGYTVVTAGNATDALQLLKVDASIDLVVTDIVMPGGLNGFDLGRRAERLRPDIKLLYMSAYAIAETIRAAQDAPLPMMRKPFKLDRLLESVETVLQH